MSEKSEQQTWFFQKPFQKYGGGPPFWDTHVHEGCLVIQSTNANPLVDRPKYGVSGSVVGG